MRYGNLPSVRASALIRLGLEDLAKCEESSSYVVLMSKWHRGGGFGNAEPCSVCLAGSVMAQSLGVEFWEEAAPGDFDGATRNKLHALDDFRCGYVLAGLMSFYDPEEIPSDRTFDSWSDWTVPRYRDDPKQWRSAMNELADYLEGEGL